MNHDSDLFVVAVLAIIIKDRKVLMMRRSPHKRAGPNLWETLSGRLHHGEDPLIGLKREIQEESALEVKLDPRPITAYMTQYIERPMLALVYKADYLSGEVNLSEEHSEYMWGTLSDFEEKSTLKRLLAAMKTLRAEIDD